MAHLVWGGRDKGVRAPGWIVAGRSLVHRRLRLDSHQQAGEMKASLPLLSRANRLPPHAEWMIHCKQYMQMSALSGGAAHKWCTGSPQEHPFVKTILKIISGVIEGCWVSSWGFFHWAHVLLAPHPLRTEI